MPLSISCHVNLQGFQHNTNNFYTCVHRAMCLGQSRKKVFNVRLKSGVGGYPLVLYETGLWCETVPHSSAKQPTYKSLPFFLSFCHFSHSHCILLFHFSSHVRAPNSSLPKQLAIITFPSFCQRNPPIKALLSPILIASFSFSLYYIYHIGVCMLLVFAGVNIYTSKANRVLGSILDLGVSPPKWS